MGSGEKGYRRLLGKGFRVKVAQTDLWVCAPGGFRETVTVRVVEIRHQLERYMSRHRGFAESLVPVEPLPGAPEVVMRMCLAGARAKVGPMAAVAGTIAQMVGESLLPHLKEGAVENGGDLFLWGDGVKKVGIFGGDGASPRVAVEIGVNGHIGICTSSGKIGHSLSMGEANAVTVICEDASLADAWATALANMVKDEKSIERVLKIAKEEGEITGAAVLFDGKIGAWGELKLSTW